MNFKSHSLLISLLLHSVSENEVVQVLCLTNHALIFPFLRDCCQVLQDKSFWLEGGSKRREGKGESREGK